MGGKGQHLVPPPLTVVGLRPKGEGGGALPVATEHENGALASWPPPPPPPLPSEREIGQMDNIHALAEHAAAAASRPRSRIFPLERFFFASI